MTASEAQAAIGVPVAPTQPTDDGFDNVCTYKSADGQHWLSVSVHVGGIDQTNFDRGKKDRNQWMPVAGVGTDACFDANSDTLSLWQALREERNAPSRRRSSTGVTTASRPS